MRKLLKRKNPVGVSKWNNGKKGKVLSFKANRMVSYENWEATIFVDVEKSGEPTPELRRKSGTKSIFAKYLYRENCRYSFLGDIFSRFFRSARC
jgi:hypothetical protein